MSDFVEECPWRFIPPGLERMSFRDQVYYCRGQRNGLDEYNKCKLPCAPSYWATKAYSLTLQEEYKEQ
jgi:hypothetical protein